MSATPEQPDSSTNGRTAEPPAHARHGAPAARRPGRLPPYHVILHNDDGVEALFVVRTLIELTPLDTHAAKGVTYRAHTQGAALILVTHRERAELYQEQFTSKGLRVSVEPAA